MSVSKNMTYDGLNLEGSDIWAARLDASVIGSRRAVRNAPVTAIQTAAYPIDDNDRYIIMNGAASLALTLPAAASWPGREIYVKTIAAYTVTSAASDVKPSTSDTAGTAILAGTAGKFALLVSDGAHWVIMAAN